MGKQKPKRKQINKTRKEDFTLRKTRKDKTTNAASLEPIKTSPICCTNRKSGPTATQRAERSVLHISGLPRDLPKIHVVDFFMRYGQVTKCKMKMSANRGLRNNSAYVEFKDPRVGRTLIERKIMCRYFLSNISVKYIEASRQNPNMFLPADCPKFGVKFIANRSMKYVQTDVDEADEIEFTVKK